MQAVILVILLLIGAGASSAAGHWEDVKKKDARTTEGVVDVQRIYKPNVIKFVRGDKGWVDVTEYTTTKKSVKEQ